MKLNQHQHNQSREIVRQANTENVVLSLMAQKARSEVAQSCPTLCDPRNHSTPGLPVHRQLPEST